MKKKLTLQEFGFDGQKAVEKKPTLRPGQRWRPNRGVWRHINGIGRDSGEIHFDDANKTGLTGGYHCCSGTDFQSWIERTKAKLVKRRRDEKTG